MRLLDIIAAPWAVTPEMLSEIQGIYARHLRGEKIDIASLSASTGIKFDNQPKGYTVENGVAVLPIDGVIAKKMNLFTQISGGTSSALISRDFAAAMADREVQAIVLAIDSPGGTVDGTPELASQIMAARGKKPIIAYSDGMMASAAYWIGSAADEIFISSEVTNVGSIGVVAQHVDVSQAEEQRGIKTTEIYAGKYKRIASQYAPLSKEGKATIQEQVDHIYSVFVDAVATHRGTDTADVLERMADGRIFQGSQAITAGLVDGVATLAATIQRARDLASGNYKQSGRAGAAAAIIVQEPKKMDLKELKEKHPDLVAAIAAETIDAEMANFAKALSEASTDAATAERERILSVKAQLMPGHEALIEQMMFDGKSTGAEAAMAIIGAEKELRKGAAAVIAQEANPVVPPASATDVKTMKRVDFNALTPEAKADAVNSGVKIVD